MKIRLPFYVLRVKYGCFLSLGILNYTWRQALNAFPTISKLWWSMVRMKASTASSGKTSSVDTWLVSMALVCLCVWGGRCPDLTWLHILFGGREKEYQNCCSLFYLNYLSLEAKTFKQEDMGITSCHTSWPLGWLKWISSQVMRI